MALADYECCIIDEFDVPEEHDCLDYMECEECPYWGIPWEWE